MFKRPHYIAFAFVLLVALVTLNLPGKTARQMKLAIRELFLPLFGVASASHTLASRAGDAVVPRSELLRENENLRTEVQRLQLQVTQMYDAWKENEQLRKLLNFQSRSPYHVKPARVIAQDPAAFWHNITIDLGSRHGVETNYTVLSAEGYLVGRVESVGLATSVVVLLGDPQCRVSAMVRETRDHGMILPRSPAPLDATLVEMHHLPPSSTIQPGQEVITSGKGGVFPSGIPIGKLIDARKVDGLNIMEARVRLLADLNRLEEVWVKFP
jgi:rod shape-determining protein MreC